MFDGMIKGAIIGAIVGAVVGVVMVLLRPARRCPRCANVLGKFSRVPRKRDGSWNCPNCGCHVDRQGNETTS